MTDEEIEQETKEIETLFSAMRFNHNKENSNSVKCLVNPDKEIKHYGLGPTQLTLPHRFGMYKTPTKDAKKTTQLDVEVPEFEPTERNANPNHKVRNIFD